MKRVVILGLTLVLLFIAADTATAVTNGTPDGTNHPYVGLIVFYSGYDSDPESPTFGLPIPMWRCSGSLLSDTAFLTAAHCITDPTPAFAYVWFNPAPPGQTGPTPDPTKYPYGGNDASGSEMYAMPGYRTDNPKSGGLPGFDYHDVAVVIIDTWLTSDSGEYAVLPTEGYVDTLPMNTEVAIVGYGVQYQRRIPGSAYPPPGQDGGLTPPYLRWAGRSRMYAPSHLIQSNNVISTEFLKLTANLGQGKGGTCFGDSGGPILDGDTVLGVNSFVTNVNCSGVTYSNRIDTKAALTFINNPIPP